MSTAEDHAKKHARDIKAEHKQYHFIFCFMGECCMKPHLWGQSATGRNESAALKKALKEVSANGREVSEYVTVSTPWGEVKEIEQ